jgi:D-3-phosphoglycerate dehydrogenase
MEPIKIVVTDYIEPEQDWEKEQLAKYENVTFEAHQLKFRPEGELLAAIGDADVIQVNMVPMTESVINQLEKCKLIIRHGAGYDNVDVKAATARGIRVGYEPDYCSDEVAQHAIMLMLACWRKLFIGQKVLEESSESGKWDFGPVYPIHSLVDKTVGIIGCGRIGSLVIEKLSGFDFNIRICDPYMSKERQDALGVQAEPLETVLKESDIVSIHAALSEETVNLIGEAQLRMMKPTAYLINTSRGGLVDTDALAKAAREGWIAGAGIDVYVKEPPDPDFPLFGLDNITLAPHLSWYSEEAGWSIREKILEDYVRFIEGRLPRFLINQELA